MDLGIGSGKQGVIYPCGYADVNQGEFLHRLLASDPSILLIDARKYPHSSWHDWDDSVLRERYPKAYRWGGKFLGNIHFADDGPIQLADPVRGIEALLIYLDQQHSFVLLCKCQDYDRCHLHVILDLLQAVLAVGRGDLKWSDLDPQDEQVVRDILLRWGNRPLPTAEVVFSEAVVRPGYAKALSVMQPWTWLLTHPDVVASCGVPAKELENRYWQTRYRGKLYLHAGNDVDSEPFNERGLLDSQYWRYYFGQAGTQLAARMPQQKRAYPRKALVGWADLVNVLAPERNTNAWSARGQYGFVLRNGQVLERPIAYAGRRRIFEVPLSVFEADKTSVLF